MADAPKRIWRTGERVSITCEDRTVQGLVELASPNGQSLLLSFEAILAGHVRLMPVLFVEERGAFQPLIGDAEISLAEPIDG